MKHPLPIAVNHIRGLESFYAKLNSEISSHYDIWFNYHEHISKCFHESKDTLFNVKRPINLYGNENK